VPAVSNDVTKAISTKNAFGEEARRFGSIVGLPL
jgi:hypothetical protein